MKYQLAQLSVGGGRAANEDRVGTAERDNAVLLVVADGLGGHSGGELASQTLVETVLRVFQGVKQPRLSDPFSFLALTILKAHGSVAARAKMHVPPLEARTTCIVCLVQDGYAYWAHVGDSRLYHFRDGKLLVRTEDHTTIEELRRDGVITEEEMANHPRKSLLLRSVGGPSPPRISLGDEVALHTGDVLLLCSDGLWEALRAEEIAAALRRPRVDEAVEEMVLAAEKRMGDACDNVSAVCLRWEDRLTKSLPLQPPRPAQVDAAQLGRGAAAKVAAQRSPRPAAPAGAKRQDRIESEIQELEEYLRRLESKG